jgi:hypothetical protein
MTDSHSTLVEIDRCFTNRTQVRPLRVRSPDNAGASAAHKSPGTVDNHRARHRDGVAGGVAGVGGDGVGSGSGVGVAALDGEEGGADEGGGQGAGAVAPIDGDAGGGELAGGCQRVLVAELGGLMARTSGRGSVSAPCWLLN